ncbi:hypothetical protein B0188_05975 [[Haemophilus] felis]|uniref:Uncharacterized protein n=1 Tax=[Haemophilus] felis TaxID=123822 RepID=A0A1T0B1C0_9PAST|nr:hypothetical protein B0188_05975 [[Haemophilus] felis]
MAGAVGGGMASGAIYGLVNKEESTVAGFAGSVVGGAISGTTGGTLGAFKSGILGGTAGYITTGFVSDVEKGIKEKKERERESDGSNSRVICTHFYQKGMLSRELWRADMEYTLKHLPQSMVNGYHLWAIPYVRLMRKSPLAEKLMYPIAYHRAREIAYQMGYTSKGSIRGKVFRAILEPICLFLGMFTKEHKYQELWRRA